MRILLVEDDQVLADGLTRSLRQAGYAVDHLVSGYSADNALALDEFDLVILDLGLPGMSGMEVLRRLRARHSAVSVLILTATDAIEQRVRLLDAGADDFMAKPFALSELEARVRALARRGMGRASPQIQHGGIVYDQSARTAFCGEQTLELSAREVALLEVLLARVGRLVSKEHIVHHLCEWGHEVSHNAVEVYIHRLRKKLDGCNVTISTVRGLGYCLERSPTAH